MDLKEILKGVSRSFYLSLRFLPARVQRSVSLAFLCCKAADTIADTKLLPCERRLEILRRYRESFREHDSELFALLNEEVSPQAANPYEQRLLLTLPVLFITLRQIPEADWHMICGLVMELTQGMIVDLEHFPGDTASELVALSTEEELDQYTYYVAGCVGRFWTRMLREHYTFAKKWDEEQEEIGEKFGKGLQLVNILRDLPRDLTRGRCYLSAEKLQEFDISLQKLLDPASLSQVRPYLNELLQRARGFLGCGAIYAKNIPAYALRLRWVVLLPMKLGFQTLDLLEQSNEWLDPNRIHKVTRGQVYRSMLTSLIFSPCPRKLVPA